MIRLFSTLQGARRAWAGPILRLIDGEEPRFVVGMTGNGVVSAISCDSPKIDGSIDVLDLMAGGTKALHNALGPAGEAVLAMVSRFRDEGIAAFDWVDLLSSAQRDATEARSGPLDHRRTCAVAAAAELILAVQQIDEEIERAERIAVEESGRELRS